MRITTQMLNASARKAGLPIHHNSLLNYIDNNNGQTQNSLLNALQGKYQNVGNQAKSENRAQYRRQEKAADNLLSQTEKFVAGGEKNLFEKAKTSGDLSELEKEAENLTEKYNSLLSAMDKNADRLGAFYGQALREVTEENKKELSQVGIMVAKDGKMSVDAEKFAASSVEDIEKILGKNSSFMKKLAVLSEKIGDNANANLASASDNYRANGMAANGYRSSKYDFWG